MRDIPDATCEAPRCEFQATQLEIASDGSVWISGNLLSGTTRLYAAASASVHFGYAVTSRLSLGLESSFLGFARADRYSFDDPSGMRRVACRSGRFAGLFALGLRVRL